MGEPFADRSPVEKMEIIEEHADDTLVHCPECDTTVWKDTIEEAVDTAEEHEENLHDGQSVVEVDGMVLPSFSDEEKDRIRETIEAIRAATEHVSGEEAADGR